MNKKMYNAPETTTVDIETSSMIASSVTYDETNSKVDFSDAVNADGANANTARVASNQYFDAWSDDEE